MARAKSVKPEDKPATKVESEPQQITIDKSEFIRTRDALITSWITLESALKKATSAYIDHSNAVLGGTQSLDPSLLDLGAFLQTGKVVPLAPLAGDGVDEDGKKQRKKRAPKDPNAPRRPLTAYLLWLGENREKIHAELGPEQKRGQISSEGTKRWHELPEATKQNYKDQYQRSREVYNKDLEEYKASGAAVADIPEEEAEADAEDAEADTKPEGGAGAGADSDASTSSDSDDSDSDEPPAPPPKEPTPPPVKTPRSAVKGSRKKAEKPAAAAPPASSPPLPASSPVKKAFTTVNGAGKRKSKADPDTAAVEEPRKKRGRKAKEDEAPVSTPVVEAPVSAKKDKKARKGRKSVGGDA